MTQRHRIEAPLAGRAFVDVAPYQTPPRSLPTMFLSPALDFEWCILVARTISAEICMHVNSKIISVLVSLHT